MRSLLGVADNTLARVPRRLLPVARQLIANLVLCNAAPVEEPRGGHRRCLDGKLPIANVLLRHPRSHHCRGSVRTDLVLSGWSDSVLAHFNTQAHSHVLLNCQQATKIAEIGRLCMYSFLACGCAPVLTLRCYGGGGASPEVAEALNAQLSGEGATGRQTSSIRDYLGHIAGGKAGGALTAMDHQYFFLRIPAGRNEGLHARRPRARSRLSLPAPNVLLQHPSLSPMCYHVTVGLCSRITA